MVRQLGAEAPVQRGATPRAYPGVFGRWRDAGGRGASAPPRWSNFGRLLRGAAPSTRAILRARWRIRSRSRTPAPGRWFETSFEAPTPAQAKGWPPIVEGRSTLLLAPTGSGKTLSAFLAAIDRLMFGPPRETEGVRVLYISPLKALGVDIERNLRAPLDPADERAQRRAIAALVRGLRLATGEGRNARAVLIERVDGEDPSQSPIATDLRAAGFAPTSRGFTGGGR